MKKYTVFHLFNSSVVSGPEKAVIPGLKFLSPSHFQTQAVFLQEARLSPHQQQGPIEYARQIGVPVRAVTVRKRLDLKAVSELRAMLKINNVAILHCHDAKATVYGLLAIRGTRIKIVSTHHGAIRHGFFNNLYVHIFHFFLRWVDMIINVSQWDKDYLAKTIATYAPKQLNKMQLLPNGIEAPKSIPSAQGFAILGKILASKNLPIPKRP
ncbi:MAG: glycosyltransferase, partial [Pseudomonadota bacterium]